jgi:hypothetical protein
MFRLFSLFGVAVLAAAAVALTTPTTIKVVRRERRLPTDANDDPRGVRAALPVSTRPLYYVRFSLN